MVHIPVEILSIIFQELTQDLLEGYKPKKKDVRAAYNLLLVSKTVRAVVEPILYREIWKPSSRRIRVLCRTMINRPEVAAMVRDVHMVEGDPDWRDDFGQGEDEEDEDEVESDMYSCKSWGSSDRNSRNRNQSRMADLDSKTLNAAADLMKARFETYGQRVQEDLRLDCLERIEVSNAHAMKWVLLVQLTNLTTLILVAHSSEFANMALILRLPRLEKLVFTVNVPPGGCYEEKFVPPEEVLDSVISSTNRLKSLQWEDISGSCAFPVIHDAPKLKEIMERNAASTLECLEVTCAMEDELGFRYDHHCADIEGWFESMENFYKLKGFSIQMEVLLGSPGNGPQLKYALPPNLERLYCDTKTDAYGRGVTERVWTDEQIFAEFEDLALAARDDLRLASLKSVGICITTRADFEAGLKPDFELEVLSESGLRFHWL